MNSRPPAARGGDDDQARVTPLGARRTSVADLQREVERLTTALQLAERRRVTAEQTLAAVGRMAATETADLRERLAAAEADLAAAGATPKAPRRRRLLRALLVVGLLVGVLAVVDGLLTIFWQEPVTMVMQERSQSALRSDLSSLRKTFAAAPEVQRETVAGRMRRQALTLLHARKDGQALGTISIPRIGLKTVMVEATTHDALAKGPGHYRGTVLPGLDGTVGIAGHRTTYGAPFRHVDALRPGSRIEVRMPYGRFVYRVTGTQIVTPDDARSLRSQPGLHRLVLTACHPLYSAAQRIVVTARQVYAAPV